MPAMTLYDAIGKALAEEMRRDPRILAFGEGIATKRAELTEEFGTQRVRNTPLAEGIIAGTAVGAAATGLRPVIDLLFAPFLCYAMDELVNSAGKLRYLSGGQFAFPLVTLAMTGAGWGVGSQHNHNLEAWFVHSPGLKVVMPSTPADACALLKAAIRDDNPVLFFIDIDLLYRPGDVPDEVPPARLGQSLTRRSGGDLTLVAYGKSVQHCLEAAETLAAEGIDAEVIDLCSLKPLDEAAILASLRRTGRLIVVHEANRLCGLGAEIAALAADQAFDALKAPVCRLAGPDAPTAGSYALEQASVPQPVTIVAAAKQLVRANLPPKIPA